VATLKEDFVIQSIVHRLLVRSNIDDSRVTFGTVRGRPFVSTPTTSLQESIWVSWMRISADGKRQEESIERSSGSHPRMNTFGSVWQESPDREDKNDGLFWLDKGA
jgi:hypothetical protein